MGQVFTEAVDCRHEFLANGKYWIHAMSEGSVVGSIAIEQHGPEWVWLNDLFVVPAFRRRGVARTLVQTAVLHARDAVQTCVGCCCGVRKSNSPSQSLFESCGFRCAWEDADGIRLYSRSL
jgi:GNAT superfamily N-acetyltransferase